MRGMRKRKCPPISATNQEDTFASLWDAVISAVQNLPVHFVPSLDHPIDLNDSLDEMVQALRFSVEGKASDDFGVTGMTLRMKLADRDEPLPPKKVKYVPDASQTWMRSLFQSATRMFPLESMVRP